MYFCLRFLEYICQESGSTEPPKPNLWFIRDLTLSTLGKIFSWRHSELLFFFFFFFFFFFCFLFFVETRFWYLMPIVSNLH